MPGILTEDETKLPRGVNTGTGAYTAGTRITSRSAPRAAVTNTRIDLPLPDFVKPAPRSTGRTQSNVQANRSAQGLVAPPITSSQAPGVSIIPAAEARSATTRAATPTRSTTAGFSASHFSANQPSGAPATDSLPAGVRETQNVYDIAGINRYDDASGVPTFTNKGREGYAEIQGMADTPALPGARVTRGPGAETPGGPPALPAARAAGGGGGFSVVGSGLFSGVSRETQQALSEARQAAEARGDFRAVERSYQNLQEREAADIAEGDAKLMNRVQRLPAAQLPAGIASVSTLATARKGKPVGLDQVKAARASELFTENPGELTATDQVLFGKSPPATQRRIVSQPVPAALDENGLPGFATGEKQYFSVDPATGDSLPVALPGVGGEAQGQAPATAIAHLRTNPKELAAAFKAKYGYLPAGL